MKRFLLLSLTLLLWLIAPVGDLLGQAQYQNFRLIGVYYNRHDNKYWIAVAALNPRYLPSNYDYQDKFTVTFRGAEGDRIFKPGDINGVPLDQHMSSAAKLMRVSLVIDNSGSIGDTNLQFVESTLEKFVRRLPVALDIQIIKFSDEIRLSGFSQDKDQIVAWIKARPSCMTRS